MKTFPTHIVAAAGIIENQNDEILLVKENRGSWVFPGGQVENGENLIDAVIREVMEETGVKIKVEKLFAVTSNTCTYKGYGGYDIVPTKVMFDFICEYVGGEPHPSDENTESKWIKKDELLNYITKPPIVARLKAYLEFNGEVQYYDYVTKPDFKIKVKRKI